MDFIFDDNMILVLILLFIVFMLPQKNCSCIENEKPICEKKEDIIYRSKRRKEKAEKRKSLCID